MQHIPSRVLGKNPREPNHVHQMEKHEEKDGCASSYNKDKLCNICTGRAVYSMSQLIHALNVVELLKLLIKTSSHNQ